MAAQFCPGRQRPAGWCFATSRSLFTLFRNFRNPPARPARQAPARAGKRPAAPISSAGVAKLAKPSASSGSTVAGRRMADAVALPRPGRWHIRDGRQQLDQEQRQPLDQLAAAVAPARSGSPLVARSWGLAGPSGTVPASQEHQRQPIAAAVRAALERLERLAVFHPFRLFPLALPLKRHVWNGWNGWNTHKYKLA